MRIHELLTLFLISLLINHNYSLAIPEKSESVSNLNEAASVARCIIHQLDWVSIATIATNDAFKGYPFADIKSMSDGPVDNSTGVPYFHLTDGIEFTGRNIAANNNCALVGSLAQTDYCTRKNTDPQNPHKCPKVLMVGKMEKIPQGTEEYNFAKNALYSRHAEMKYWPTDHGFYFAKFKIEYIKVLYNNFARSGTVSVEDYYSAKPSACMEE